MAARSLPFRTRSNPLTSFPRPVSRRPRIHPTCAGRPGPVGSFPLYRTVDVGQVNSLRRGKILPGRCIEAKKGQSPGLGPAPVATAERILCSRFPVSWRSTRPLVAGRGLKKRRRSGLPRHSNFWVSSFLWVRKPVDNGDKSVDKAQIKASGVWVTRSECHRPSHVGTCLSEYVECPRARTGVTHSKTKRSPRTPCHA